MPCYDSRVDEDRVEDSALVKGNYIANSLMKTKDL